MKKALSVILILLLLCNCGLAEQNRMKGKNSPGTQTDLQEQIYKSVVEGLNSEDYFVENVSTTYLSDEYLEELEFNTKANIYFGYNLEVLEQQFQGKKFIFTLGDDNETTVTEWKEYKDPVTTLLKSSATGAGIILVYVTVSFATAGTPVGMFFAARTAQSVIGFEVIARQAISGAVIEYVKTGDPNKALKAAAEKSENMPLIALGGTVAKASPLLGAALNGLTTSEAAAAQQESKYPLSIIKEFRSVEEYNVYKEAGLYTESVGGETALIRNIDWKQKDTQGKTNLERMSAGENPLDSNGSEYDVNLIGQKGGLIPVILTQAESNGEGTFENVHEQLRCSETTDPEYKEQFWKDLATTISNAMIV